MSEQTGAFESRRPRRYQIRERILTVGDHFKIKDEFGCHRYTVRSKAWTLNKRLVLEDSHGNGLLKIRHKGFHFLDQFSIESAAHGQVAQPVATVRQKLTFFKHSYVIYSIYGEYRLKGLNAFDHSFVLKRKDGLTVALVNKKFFSMADVYGIELVDAPHNGKDQEDHAFVLALIIALHCSLFGS